MRQTLRDEYALGALIEFFWPAGLIDPVLIEHRDMVRQSHGFDLMMGDCSFGIRVALSGMILKCTAF